MTKADIIESVYEKVGFSKKESAELVELVFDTLKETLERGDKVKISGFGNFQPRYKRARPGRSRHVPALLATSAPSSGRQRAPPTPRGVGLLGQQTVHGESVAAIGVVRARSECRILSVRQET